MYTTLKEISNTIAEKLNLDPELVYQVNLTYWNKVKEKMTTNTSHIYLSLIHIGYMKANRTRVRKSLNIYREKLTKLDKIKNEKYYNLFSNKIENLNKLTEEFINLDNHVKDYYNKLKQ